MQLKLRVKKYFMQQIMWFYRLFWRQKNKFRTITIDKLYNYMIDLITLT